MINFLPLIYQDELFFSIISRYKQMCGMESKRALEMDLFQIYKRMGRKSVLFPQNLITFVSNLPPTSKITVEEIINNNTMFPFYTAFLSNERTETMYRGMEKGFGNNIENLVGLAGGKVKSTNCLRYCPVCFEEDIEKLGESYWRRLPQVPGTLYCPIHQVLYKNSTVVITDSRNDFKCADEATCSIELVVDPFPSQFKELNLQYVENVSYILFQNKSRKELTFIINYYIDRLRERSLASNVGSLYIDRLLENFSSFYPSKYLELMQSSVNEKQETNWLRLFIRNNKKNRSPLRHLLFLQFLNIEVKEFFECIEVIGKQTVSVNRTPLYSIEERRREWLKLIKENPTANRSELKRIAKGLHTWVFAYDREWYDEVTPKIKIKKKRAVTINWKKRDEECLELAKIAVDNLLNMDGKPIRIRASSIRREIGATRWFNNSKLKKTRKYIEQVTENIEAFRERKIKWAINELSGESITVYRIQLKAGFGGGNNERIKAQIKELLACNV